jgi:hypothetical protein
MKVFYISTEEISLFLSFLYILKPNRYGSSDVYHVSSLDFFFQMNIQKGKK